MKKFVYPIIFTAGILAGIIIKGFIGGFVTGAAAMLLIFVTLGKYLIKKIIITLS